MAEDVRLIPADRKLRTPEERRKYENAKRAWGVRKATDADSWVLLEREWVPETGMEYIREFNPETEMFRERRRFHYFQDLVDVNAASYADSINKRFGDLAKVASIPPNLAYGEWKQPLSENDHQWINRKLNDPDYRKLRTFRGRL